MTTIVVGYDGSESAERALGRAAEIAEAFSARLLVVSVSRLADALAFEPAMGPVPAAVAGPGAAGVAAPPPEPAPAAPEPEELARQELEKARGALRSRSVDAEYIVELGDPAERLLDIAEQRDGDLIVVGSRGHGFLERLLSRPVDESVARRAERDVLLVH